MLGFEAAGMKRDRDVILAIARNVCQQRSFMADSDLKEDALFVTALVDVCGGGKGFKICS